MSRLLIASPHRYPDLARLWHRLVMRELAPAFARLGLAVEVNIFCDANADRFLPDQFPGVRFSSTGPGARDFMEFYDATLHAECEFILFLDADTFLMNGAWASSYFDSFSDPDVAGVSFVPRKQRPAIFALLCRADHCRALTPPVFACRYEFPKDWPRGVNLQPGDFAVRELAKSGKVIVNIDADESSRYTANFRGTTGLRSSREHTIGAAGEDVFLRSVSEYGAYLVAAYDNVLLGCLYESLYHEPFAPGPSGVPLGGSLTLSDLRRSLLEVRDATLLGSLRKKFERSRRNIVRMAAQENVKLSIPLLFSDEQ